MLGVLGIPSWSYWKDTIAQQEQCLTQLKNRRRVQRANDGQDRRSRTLPSSTATRRRDQRTRDKLADQAHCLTQLQHHRRRSLIKNIA